MEPKFFFDTADISYITKVWDKLSRHVPKEAVMGITTNPNALSKVNCNTLEGLCELVRKLSELLAYVREDNLGEVYVQVPSSIMKLALVTKWCEFISLISKKSVIGVKIPPFTPYLELSASLKNVTPVNVTGIADWGTILKSLSYPSVNCASLIPGRMDEKGIPANSHMRFLMGTYRRPYQNIITGSMRTVDGLRDAIAMNTVPTIGTRVWDELLSDDTLYLFPEYWYNPRKYESLDYISPDIAYPNQQLTIDFFLQMDKLGKNMFEEFEELYDSTI